MLHMGLKKWNKTFFQAEIIQWGGPARQFVASQQRGSNVSCICVKDHVNLKCCLKVKYLDLEDRRKLLLKGTSWEKIK